MDSTRERKLAKPEAGLAVAGEVLRDLIVSVLDDRKGEDITTLDVRKLTDITDYMIIVSGTSRRHVKSLVDYVIECAKAAGASPLGVEGRETHDWVLLDLGDVVVHVMQAEARAFYDLERLWEPLRADSDTRK